MGEVSRGEHETGADETAAEETAPVEGRTTTSQRLEQLSDSLREKLVRARFLLLDVDGVLTDGRLWFDADGREAKVFHVHDGSALVYWKRCGFGSGLIV